jgi:hypothetical protein
METSNFFWQNEDIYLSGKNFFINKYKKDSSQFLNDKKNMQHLLNYCLDEIKNECRNVDIEEDDFEDDDEILQEMHNIIPNYIRPFLKSLSCTLYIVIQSDKNRRTPPFVHTLIRTFKKIMNLKLYSLQDITVTSLQDVIKQITHWIINSSIELMIYTPDLHQLFPINMKTYNKIDLLAYVTVSIFRYDV